jgi:spore coat protein CotH
MESANFIHEIRGRGNSTWGYPKKPYRIRFNSKTSLFGLTAARNWVLLAHWKDWTLLSDTVAFELGHRLGGLSFVNNAVHVDVVLNGTYNGNYVLTEQVQVNPGRVDIDPNAGYLVEFDTYEDDNYNFYTGTSYLRTWVKSPDLGGGWSPGYQFVVDSVNNFDRLLNGGGFPDNGYRDLVNMASFVDYLMVYEVTRNYELGHPKSSYMHKDRGPNEKINMGPIWDFDWAYGLHENQTILLEWGQGGFVRDHKFGRFFGDPQFLSMYKARWIEKYNAIQSMPGYIDTMYNQLKVSASLDAARWHSNPSQNTGNFYYVSYAREVGILKTWWQNRVAWLDAEIRK